MNYNFCSQDATVITPSSVNPNYPAANLKHPFRSKRWRSTTPASQSVVFDLITTEAIDSVVLLWSKEDGIQLSNTAVVKIQASATNVWTSPPVDQVLTIDNVYMLASFYFTSDQNYRYWRVTIDDPGNANGYVELGVAWLGKGLAIDNAQNGFKFTRIDTSKVTLTDFGHQYVDIYPVVSSIEITYVNLDYDIVQIIDDAYLTNGTRTPVMFVLNAEGDVFDKNHFTLYGMFKNTFGLTHVRYNILNVDSITVTELS
jgi:hypothetical protein